MSTKFADKIEMSTYLYHFRIFRKFSQNINFGKTGHFLWFIQQHTKDKSLDL